MIMKKNVVLLMSLLVMGLVVSSCQVSCKNGPRDLVDVTDLTIATDQSEFERVVVEAACDVKFIQSDKSRVVMKSDGSEARLMESVVKDGVLYVRYKNAKGSKLLRVRDVNVSVTIYSPDLIGLELRGAGQVDIDGLDTDTLKLELRGAGDVRMKNIVCDRIDAMLKGAGSINIDSLTTEQASLALNGVGNVEVGFVNSGVVDCELKGVGNVKLRGNVRKWSSSVKGTGNVDTHELTVDK